MTKITIFRENLRFLAVLKKIIKNGQKVTLNWRSTHERKGYHVKTIEQLKILFSPKDVSYNLTKRVTKFQQPLSITLGVADEKPGGTTLSILKLQWKENKFFSKFHVLVADAIVFATVLGIRFLIPWYR